METKKELTPEQRKAELIRKFAEILDRHTKDEGYISMAIAAMLEMKELIYRTHEIKNEGITSLIRNIREHIALSSSSFKEEELDLFDSLTEMFFDAIFLYINHPYGIETIAKIGADPDLDKARRGD